MNLNGRDFGKTTLPAASVPTGTLLAAMPTSNFTGVQIGAITSSYKSEPGAGNAQELLRMVANSRISAIRSMPPAAESSFHFVDRRCACL